MRPVHVFSAMLVTLLWGLNFVVIRIGLDHFPPLFLLAIRFTLAALPLVFFLPRPSLPWRLILGLGLVFGVVKFALLFIALDTGLSPGLASLLLQSQAFFTLLLVAFLFREPISRLQITGVAIAFGGITLIGLTIDVGMTSLGLTLVLLSGFAWAVSNLMMKKAGQVDMLALMVWISLVPPIPLFLLSLIFEGTGAMLQAVRDLNLTGAGAILYITYVGTVFGFTIWGRLIRLYGAGRVAPFSLLVPVFGMTSSAVFLGESFGPLRLLAALLVLAGLVLTIFKSSTNSVPD